MGKAPTGVQTPKLLQTEHCLRFLSTDSLCTPRLFARVPHAPNCGFKAPDGALSSRHGRASRCPGGPRARLGRAPGLIK